MASHNNSAVPQLAEDPWEQIASDRNRLARPLPYKKSERLSVVQVVDFSSFLRDDIEYASPASAGNNRRQSIREEQYQFNPQRLDTEMAVESFPEFAEAVEKVHIPENFVLPTPRASAPHSNAPGNRQPLTPNNDISGSQSLNPEQFMQGGEPMGEGIFSEEFLQAFPTHGISPGIQHPALESFDNPTFITAGQNYLHDYFQLKRLDPTNVRYKGLPEKVKNWLVSTVERNRKKAAATPDLAEAPWPDQLFEDLLMKDMPVDFTKFNANNDPDILDLGYDPLNDDLNPEQEAMKAKQCADAAELIFGGAIYRNVASGGDEMVSMDELDSLFDVGFRGNANIPQMSGGGTTPSKLSSSANNPPDVTAKAGKPIPTAKTGMPIGAGNRKDDMVKGKAKGKQKEKGQEDSAGPEDGEVLEDFSSRPQNTSSSVASRTDNRSRQQKQNIPIMYDPPTAASSWSWGASNSRRGSFHSSNPGLQINSAIISPSHASSTGPPSPSPSELFQNDGFENTRSPRNAHHMSSLFSLQRSPNFAANQYGNHHKHHNSVYGGSMPSSPLNPNFASQFNPSQILSPVAPLNQSPHYQIPGSPARGIGHRRASSAISFSPYTPFPATPQNLPPYHSRRPSNTPASTFDVDEDLASSPPKQPNFPPSSGKKCRESATIEFSSVAQRKTSQAILEEAINKPNTPPGIVTRADFNPESKKLVVTGPVGSNVRGFVKKLLPHEKIVASMD